MHHVRHVMVTRRTKRLTYASIAVGLTVGILAGAGGSAGGWVLLIMVVAFVVVAVKYHAFHKPTDPRTGKMRCQIHRIIEPHTRESIWCPHCWHTYYDEAALRHAAGVGTTTSVYTCPLCEGELYRA